MDYLQLIYDFIRLWFYIWLVFRMFDVVSYVSRRIGALLRSGAWKE